MAVRGTSELAHIHAVVAEAGAILSNKSAADRLSFDEREFMGAQITAIKTALGAQEAARAWSLVTDSRFWTNTRTRVAPMRRPKSRARG